MPHFRKKPVVIEARQFETNNDDGSHLDSLVAWITSQGGEACHDDTSLFIETLEGTHRADCSDWIIKGIKGEFYPCKPDIFEATYEPVGDESSEERTSPEVASLASRGLSDPASLSPEEIRAVCASALTQVAT